MNTKQAAVISENVVIASAYRYTGFRQSAWMICSSAESSVPECPMPIQKMKVAMYRLQTSGLFMPDTPMPRLYW